MKLTPDSFEKFDAQLKRWGIKIDELVARAEGSGTQAAANSRERIAELRAKRAAALARCDELRAAGSWKWRRFKGDIAIAWNDLVVAFRALERQTGV